MQLNANQKRRIEQVINVFETGTVSGDYSIISIFHDGPHNIRQITYGRSQTTEYGNLRLLVRRYVDGNGIYSQNLAQYADLVGSTPLTDESTFKSLLRKAGREDPIMKRVQDAFFEDVYFKPAMNWADTEKFVLPLSALVIYDSFIHSGGIRWIIRSKFPENTPLLGGDEMAWISAYVKARHTWLKAHPRPIVQKTIYRTECFRREINKGNWDLSHLPINANGTRVS